VFEKIARSKALKFRTQLSRLSGKLVKHRAFAATAGNDTPAANNFARRLAHANSSAKHAAHTARQRCRTRL
jgi:hypothetical protein